MKKALFLALVTALTLLPSSCTKYDAPDIQPPPPPPAGTTSYTFTIYDSDFKVYLYEYNEIGEMIHSNIIDNAEKDVPYTYAAQDNAVKIKVRLNYLTAYWWVQQVYYLDEGENIDIAIIGSTLVGDYEP
jgi:hypothetical protein